MSSQQNVHTGVVSLELTIDIHSLLSHKVFHPIQFSLVNNYFYKKVSTLGSQACQNMIFTAKTLFHHSPMHTKHKVIINDIIQYVSKGNMNIIMVFLSTYFNFLVTHVCKLRKRLT